MGYVILAAMESKIFHAEILNSLSLSLSLSASARGVTKTKKQIV